MLSRSKAMSSFVSEIRVSALKLTCFRRSSICSCRANEESVYPTREAALG